MSAAAQADECNSVRQSFHRTGCRPSLWRSHLAQHQQSWLAELAVCPGSTRGYVCSGLLQCMLFRSGELCSGVLELLRRLHRVHRYGLEQRKWQRHQFFLPGGNLQRVDLHSGHVTRPLLVNREHGRALWSGVQQCIVRSRDEGVVVCWKVQKPGRGRLLI